MNSWPAAALLLFALATGAAHADSLRCGSALVSQGDHATEVLDKCGEPRHYGTRGYKLVIDGYGYRQEVPIEEWTYGPWNGMYYRLVFEGGRQASIRSRRE